MLTPVWRPIKRALQAAYARHLGVWGKEVRELMYWRRRVRAEGTLRNDHYAQFYTSYFGLSPDFYAGKRLLDIGCGPRGSLEWANMTAERVGLDTLAKEYLRLHPATRSHRMRYVDAPSEAIPFPDRHFDVIASFNSLDHVADVRKTIGEIDRVLKPGGLFLLIVEVNHPPTATEHITLPWDVPAMFGPGYEASDVRRYEIGPEHDIYGEILKDRRFDERDPRDRPGVLTAKLRKVTR